MCFYLVKVGMLRRRCDLISRRRYANGLNVDKDVGKGSVIDQICFYTGYVTEVFLDSSHRCLQSACLMIKVNIADFHGQVTRHESSIKQRPFMLARPQVP